MQILSKFAFYSNCLIWKWNKASLHRIFGIYSIFNHRNSFRIFQRIFFNRIVKKGFELNQLLYIIQLSLVNKTNKPSPSDWIYDFLKIFYGRIKFCSQTTDLLLSLQMSPYLYQLFVCFSWIARVTHVYFVGNFHAQIRYIQCKRYALFAKLLLSM